MRTDKISTWLTWRTRNPARVCPQLGNGRQLGTVEESWPGSLNLSANLASTSEQSALGLNLLLCELKRVKQENLQASCRR